MGVGLIVAKVGVDAPPAKPVPRRLVFKALRLLYHSTLVSRVVKKKKKEFGGWPDSRQSRSRRHPGKDHPGNEAPLSVFFLFVTLEPRVE